MFDAYIKERVGNWAGEQHYIIELNSSDDVMSSDVSPPHWLNPDIADQVSFLKK